MSETAIVTCTVLDIRTVHQGRLVAVAEVELDFEGVVLVLEGVQVVRLRVPGNPQDIASVRLPRYRTQDGTWRQAIRLPPELESVLGDVVMTRCNDLGITNCRRTLMVGK